MEIIVFTVLAPCRILILYVQGFFSWNHIFFYSRKLRCISVLLFIISDLSLLEISLVCAHIPVPSYISLAFVFLRVRSNALFSFLQHFRTNHIRLPSLHIQCVRNINHFPISYAISYSLHVEGRPANLPSIEGRRILDLREGPIHSLESSFYFIVRRVGSHVRDARETVEALRRALQERSAYTLALAQRSPHDGVSDCTGSSLIYYNIAQRFALIA